MTIRFFAIAALLSLAACTVSSEPESPPTTAPIEESVSTPQSAPIASCQDWNGLCTGLPEGAACGKNGTCVPDVYGAAGFCTCLRPPPPPCPLWTSGMCGGQAPGSTCRRLPPASGYGTCQPTATGCECR